MTTARPSRSYHYSLDALRSVLDLSIVDSFCDVADEGSRLPEVLSAHHPGMRVVSMGLDDSAQVVERYEIVHCTRIDEHLGRGGSKAVLGRLVDMTEDILILGRSRGTSRLGTWELIEDVERLGLRHWSGMTRRLGNTLRKNELAGPDEWWMTQPLVFKRISNPALDPNCYIQGCDDLDEGFGHLNLFCGSDKGREIQPRFMRLCEEIVSRTASSKPYSLLRLGDGDYFFMRGLERGSARPGYRALTRSYRDMDLSAYRRLLWLNDSISVISSHPTYSRMRSNVLFHLVDRSLFRVLDPHSKAGIIATKILDRLLNHSAALSDNALTRLLGEVVGRRLHRLDLVRKAWEHTLVPIEAVYALVATRWIFRRYPSSIALVGAKEKLDIIKRLMEHEAYRRYIGVENFKAYVEIPQIGAADDLEALSAHVGGRLKGSGAQVVLLGIGSAKIGLLPRLKEYGDFTLIDVGVGIDALAGIISPTRPFFRKWKNYRLPDFDYSKIDFLDRGCRMREESYIGLSQ